MPKGLEGVPVEGIWLRRIGNDLQVLAQVDGRWKLVIEEHWGGNISYIVEPPGILNAKEVKL